MKILFMSLIISSLLLSFSKAQIPAEAFTLTNSLPDLWNKGETEKAVESSLKLFSLYRPLFIERIHNTLAQSIQKDSKLYCQKYLQQLFLKNNKEINNIISPIYLWSRSTTVKNKSDFNKIVEDLNKLFKDTSNYYAETERYSLLILQELDKKNAIDIKGKEKILKKNVSNLESYPYITKIATGRTEGEKRAWHRYLLAYSYNYLYSFNPSVENYLKKASDYSPDLNDKIYTAGYFYDAAILTGNPREIGFQNKYQKYLVDHKRNSEALELLSDITFKEPTDSNIKSLKDFYEKSNKTLFKEYWINYFNKLGHPVPRLKFKFDKEELDFNKKYSNWIYIDVWGTWCSPCRKELPELQSYFKENKNSKIKIYTLSFSSQDLQKFMSKNKYTFPVCEIDQNTCKLFEVKGYPTKILISPDGKFIIIPFGADWRMYIKNYTLM